MDFMTPAKTRNHRPPKTTGVLLTNTGTPDAPTTPALRRFLAQFLTDRRVIKTPRWLWLPILHGVILNTRPRRSARLYQRIWTPQGSPLLLTSQLLAEGITHSLQSLNDLPIKVATGMRYGSPSIADGLSSLREQGAERTLVFPLFPQYSATTTASALDAVFTELQTWRVLPKLRTRVGYHDHPAYIHALAQSIQGNWEKNGEPDRLLFSFHGIPESYAQDGDPYPQQCRTTARLVAEQLGLEDSRWQVSFQSRFGSQTWLEPYTAATLVTWGRAGVRSVNVVCPGFSTDCLETLYEIDIEARQVFLEAGGSQFSYIPALNDHTAHIQALTDIILSDLSGWLDSEHREHEVRATGSLSALPEVNDRVSIN
jgi:ferrochelatase